MMLAARNFSSCLLYICDVFNACMFDAPAAVRAA